MAGYHNYSMSNNARAAYNCGEMPLSRWTKDELLARCGDRADTLRVLTAAELKARLLSRTSWHHTSSHYNRTDFYSFDEDALEALTAEAVLEIVSARKPRAPRQAPAVKTITAEITYTVWEGRFRNYRRPKDYTEIVSYPSTAKQVETSNGVKRLSSLKSIRVISED